MLQNGRQGNEQRPGPSIRPKRYEAGFQGLQAHEKKYKSKESRIGFKPSVFACHGFLFRLAWIGFVWSRTGVE